MIIEALGIDRSRVAAVLDRLRARNETVAVAESLTAGTVTSALTDLAGASAVVRGGVIVYATDLKASLLDVDPVLLDRHGPVHPLVAEELAAGVRRTCGADWGIGLTGVAGPDPQGGVPPGTVHVGFAGPQRSAVRSIHVDGDRHAVRSAAVRVALEHFETLLC